MAGLVISTIMGHDFRLTINESRFTIIKFRFLDDDMQTTRQRILEYLREYRLASARTLSHAWGMTAANVRHHLGRLAEEGLVEVAGQ